jgi:uncharacterized protein
MQIVIAGGSGFLGRALVGALRRDGHRVRVLTRRPRDVDDVAWKPEPDDQRAQSWTPEIDGADAVINLAGASIGGTRWNAAHKKAIRDSRLKATGALVLAIVNARRRPPVFVSASAIGFYGNRGDQRLTEDSPPGTGFLAEVCRDWERIALEAGPLSRVVRVRSGLVLGRGGGALPPMALPFRLFVGGPVGTGTQYMSWIHIDDWVAMVRWALHTDAVCGALNLTPPVPVTNTEFAHALGRALHRPALVRTPAFAVRVLLGQEMAEALVLGGQRVLPTRAEALGYSFKYPTLTSALAAIYA